MTMLTPVKLSGPLGGVVPLDAAHAPALRDAVADGALWKLWYTSIPSPEGMQAEIARRLDLQARGVMLPFTIVDAAGTPVGMTTYMNLEPEVPRLEIGSTWYARRVQRTGLNTQCKLLLLTHAFEALDCLAVEFRTAFFNRQSRRAIERLGARLDGILRHHRRYPDGSLRDTCVYSITATEWPAVRTHLEFLQQHGGRATSLEDTA